MELTEPMSWLKFTMNMIKKCEDHEGKILSSDSLHEMVTPDAVDLSIHKVQEAFLWFKKFEEMQES